MSKVKERLAKELKAIKSITCPHEKRRRSQCLSFVLLYGKGKKK